VALIEMFHYPFILRGQAIQETAATRTIFFLPPRRGQIHRGILNKSTSIIPENLW
jgi:hypothetical protein